MSGPSGFNSTNMTMEMRALRVASGSPPARLERLSLYTPLLLVLILQMVGGAVLLHNTPFQDEALYSYAGMQLLGSLLGGPALPAYFSAQFSGYPYVYPPLAAVLLHIGGIEAVRWFSSVCMLIVTVCVYSVTRRLFNRASALTAACLFACAGTTLLLSRLATFDALALMLLAVATAVSIQVSAARDPAGALMIAPLLILAVGAKYASLLFLPLVVGLMVVRTAVHQGWGRAVLHLALTLVGMAILTIPLAHVVDRDALSAISVSTTNRTAIIPASSGALAHIIFSLAGPLWALSLFGMVLSPKRMRLVALGLLLAAAAPAIYHLHASEQVSLQKHIGYGLFFAAPLAGFAVAEMTSRITPARLDPRWLAGMMICLVMFAIGAEESQWWYHTWPDSSQLVTTMRTQVRPGSPHYLCEDFEVLRLALSDLTTNDQYTSLGFFEYTDAQGHHYAGKQAYASAIAAGYFDLVELSFSNSALSGYLEKTLRAQSQYELIAVIPYTNSYGSSHYMIWRKRGP